MCKSFSCCLLYGPCIICVHFMLNFYFLRYLHNILKMYLSVISSFCFYVVFVLLLLHLSVCFVSLWLTPHPIVAITNLRIHGMNEWDSVCVHACSHMPINKQYLERLNDFWQDINEYLDVECLNILTTLNWKYHDIFYSERNTRKSFLANHSCFGTYLCCYL